MPGPLRPAGALGSGPLDGEHPRRALRTPTSAAARSACPGESCSALTDASSVNSFWSVRWPGRDSPLLQEQLARVRAREEHAEVWVLGEYLARELRATHAGQDHVGQHEVDVAGLSEVSARLRRIRGKQHIEAVQGERVAECHANQALILKGQNARLARVRRCGWFDGECTGNSTPVVVPRPSSLSTSTRPRRRCTLPWTM